MAMMLVTQSCLPGAAWGGPAWMAPSLPMLASSKIRSRHWPATSIVQNV